ncbi:ABC transporter permease [Dictyoglomus thermophilum]|uniref:ABC-type transport system, involved in lipoprotein release, permease component n=1 Tax=Dictyoglomus thermophilum (strain ATCC 35947 / DSM 3960 / H-6-12) TaxID=309799 RepID=B5YD48_DICT6|nr:ABC transporter permease [Dictyoglomus thermophilum]ACI20154.1 ABC-type transport system, involved in lipoprotein release, permease component [Dictyoglomus thermophilum H-6-12]
MKTQIKENLRLAVYSLISNKLRSFLTILGIIIGVFSVVLLISIGEGAKNQTLQIIENLGSNTLIIFPSSTETGGTFRSIQGQRPRRGMPQLFSYNDLLYLRNIFRNELLVSSLVSSPYNVYYQIFPIEANVQGTDNDGILISKDSIIEGRFFTSYEQDAKEKVCIVGPKIAKSIAISYKEATNKIIKIGDHNFRIIGILKERGYSQNLGDLDSRIIIPLTTALMLKGDQTLNFIIAQVKENKSIETYRQKLIFVLKQRRGKLNFVIAKQEDLLSAMNDILNILTLTLAGIAAISLIVGGIGIMNIMLVSVTERYKEIGIRKAIGAKKRDILIQFLTESAFLGMIGGTLGIALSIIAGEILSKFEVPYSLSYSTLILGFSFSLFIGLIFGVLPAMRAANLDPIQALRSE